MGNLGATAEAKARAAFAVAMEAAERTALEYHDSDLAGVFLAAAAQARRQP